MKIFRLFMMMVILVANRASSAETVDSTFSIPGTVGKLSVRLQIQHYEEGEKIPVVIFCHGLGDNKNNLFFDEISKYALRENMGVVRFDFNGHGDSDGAFEKMDAINIQEDLRNVIAWTIKQPFTKNVSLVGHSLGGIVVGVVAPEYSDKDISGIVMLAPGGVAPDLMLMGNFYGFKFDPWNPPDYIPIGNHRRLGKNYIETMRDLPIYQTARKYYGHALILNGLKDNIVPYTYAMRYNEVMPMAELRLIKDENHMFSETREQTAKDIITWLHTLQK